MSLGGFFSFAGAAISFFSFLLWVVVLVVAFMAMSKSKKNSTIMMQLAGAGLIVLAIVGGLFLSLISNFIGEHIGWTLVRILGLLKEVCAVAGLLVFVGGYCMEKMAARSASK